MASSEITCWAGVYTWWTCCPWPVASTSGQAGNPACWSEGFSYAECCKAGPPGYERLGNDFSALRAELRKVRGDCLDCRGVPFIIWDMYFDLLRSFTRALSEDDLKAFLLQAVGEHGAGESARDSKAATSVWRSQVDQVMHWTEFLIDVYRPLLTRPLVRAHGMSVPMVGLEDSAESSASPHETLALASFCFYGFFTAVLVRLAYSLPLLPETHSVEASVFQTQEKKDSSARKHMWALAEHEVWNHTLQALGTWIPSSEYVDFWGESRWGLLLGRGDLLLESLREELGFPLYNADYLFSNFTTKSWLPHRGLPRRPDSIRNRTRTTDASPATPNPKDLPALQPAPARERAELSLAAFEQMRRRLDALLTPKDARFQSWSWQTPLSEVTPSASSRNTQKLTTASMPRSLATAVWSNHFGDALEIMGLLRSALPPADGWKWTWHFAGLDHPGGRAGTELKSQVCGKLGSCRAVPFMGSLYMTGSAFSDADDSVDTDDGTVGASLAEAYATELQSLKVFLDEGDSAYGPGADLLVCSQPFLACALLGEVLPVTLRILVYLHYPPLFNIAHPRPVFAALQQMLTGQSSDLSGFAGEARPRFAVICGAPLDCLQLACLLGSDSAESVIYAPPVAAYVSASAAKHRDFSTNAKRGAPPRALVWRLHHFLGGWAWNLVSMWPGLLERHLDLVNRRDAKLAKPEVQVELQFYGVVEMDQLAMDTFFTHEDLAAFLAIVLIPWDLTLKTFDELYAIGTPLLVPGARFATGLALHTMLRSPERYYWYHLRERHWGGPLAREAAARCTANSSEGGSLFFNRQRFTLHRFATAWGFSDFSLRPCVHKFDGAAEMFEGLLLLLDPDNAASVRACMRQHQERQMALASEAIRRALRQLWPQESREVAIAAHALHESYRDASTAPGMVVGNGLWLPLLARASGHVATDQHERVVEVPLAHYFLQKACAGPAARQCMEIGAVTPYWSASQELDARYGHWVRTVPVPGHVLDLNDAHPAVTARPDLAEPQEAGYFTGKSVLSISTFEHFGWDDAPDLSTRAAGWHLVQQICHEARHYLLTWGLGWNPFLDLLLEKSNKSGSGSCSFIVLRRTGQLQWEVDGKRRLRQLYGCTVWQQVRPDAGAVDWDKQGGFHGGSEHFWWRTDRTDPDMLPLFESSAMRRNLVPPGPVVPVCPSFRYFGRKVYDEGQLEAHFPGANAVVVITNLPELLQIQEGGAS